MGVASHQPFNELIASYQQNADRHGPCAASAAHDIALGKIIRSSAHRRQMLAYSDVFFYAGIVAFCVVPFCFFLTGKRAVGGPGAGAH